MPTQSEETYTSSDEASPSGARKEWLRKNEHHLKGTERRKRRKRPAWSLEEEGVLAEKHAVHGNAWILIAKSLPGRTSSEVKNIYNSTLRATRHSARSLLRAYAFAVQGNEHDDNARHKAYNSVLHAYEDESRAAAEAEAAGGDADGVSTTVVDEPLAAQPPPYQVDMMQPLSMMQLQGHAWPFGVATQLNNPVGGMSPERLHPQDQLRLALLHQHQQLLRDHQWTPSHLLQEEQHIKHMQALGHVQEPIQALDQLSQPIQPLDQLSQPMQTLDQLPQHMQNLDQLTQHMQNLDQLPQHMQNLDQLPQHVQNLHQLPQHMQALDQLPQHMQALDQQPQHMQALDQLPQHMQALHQLPQHMQTLHQLPQHMQTLDQLPQHMQAMEHMQQPMQPLERLQQPMQPLERLQQPLQPLERLQQPRQVLSKLQQPQSGDGEQLQGWQSKLLHPLILGPSPPKANALRQNGMEGIGPDGHAAALAALATLERLGFPAAANRPTSNTALGYSVDSTVATDGGVRALLDLEHPQGPGGLGSDAARLDLDVDVRGGDLEWHQDRPVDGGFLAAVVAAASSSPPGQGRGAEAAMDVGAAPVDALEAAAAASPPTVAATPPSTAAIAAVVAVPANANAATAAAAAATADLNDCAGGGGEGAGAVKGGPEMGSLPLLLLPQPAQQSLPPSSGLPSPRQAAAVAGTRKRQLPAAPLDSAADRQAAKRSRRRNGSVVRGTQPRREGLFKSDGEDSPPEPSPIRSNSPGVQRWALMAPAALPGRLPMDVVSLQERMRLPYLQLGAAQQRHTHAPSPPQQQQPSTRPLLPPLSRLPPPPPPPGATPPLLDLDRLPFEEQHPTSQEEPQEHHQLDVLARAALEQHLSPPRSQPVTSLQQQVIDLQQQVQQLQEDKKRLMQVRVGQQPQMQSVAAGGAEDVLDGGDLEPSPEPDIRSSVGMGRKGAKGRRGGSIVRRGGLEPAAPVQRRNRKQQQQQDKHLVMHRSEDGDGGFGAAVDWELDREPGRQKQHMEDDGEKRVEGEGELGPRQYGDDEGPRQDDYYEPPTDFPGQDAFGHVPGGTSPPLSFPPQLGLPMLNPLGDLGLGFADGFMPGRPGGPSDPPLVMLRPSNGGPTVLCVAVPLIALPSADVPPNLKNVPIGDMPPGMNVSAGPLPSGLAFPGLPLGGLPFAGLNAAAAAAMVASGGWPLMAPPPPAGFPFGSPFLPPLGGEDLPPPGHGLPPGRSMPEGDGLGNRARGRGPTHSPGFEALAAAAAVAAAGSGPASRRPGSAPEPVFQGPCRGSRGAPVPAPPGPGGKGSSWWGNPAGAASPPAAGGGGKDSGKGLRSGDRDEKGKGASSTEHAAAMLLAAAAGMSGSVGAGKGRRSDGAPGGPWQPAAAAGQQRRGAVAVAGAEGSDDEVAVDRRRRSQTSAALGAGPKYPKRTAAEPPRGGPKRHAGACEGGGEGMAEGEDADGSSGEGYSDHGNGDAPAPYPGPATLTRAFPPMGFPGPPFALPGGCFPGSLYGLVPGGLPPAGPGHLPDRSLIGRPLRPEDYDLDPTVLNTERAYAALLEAFPGSPHPASLGPSAVALGGLGPSRPAGWVGGGGVGAAPAAWAATAATRRMVPQFLPSPSPSQALLGLQMQMLMAQMGAAPPGGLLGPGRVQLGARMPMQMQTPWGSGSVSGGRMLPPEHGAGGGGGGSGVGAGGAGAFRRAPSLRANAPSTARSGRNAAPRQHDDEMDSED